MTITTFNVLANADDGHWRTDGSSFGYSTATIRLGNASSPYYESWIRFKLDGINPGAVLNAATLRLTAANGPTAATTVKVTAEATDDAANPSSYANAKAKARTTTNLQATIATHAVGATVDLNVTAIVQEIIDRGGWTAGGHVLFLIEHVSSGYVHLFHALPGGTTPPQLILDYSGGTGGGGAPVTVTARPAAYQDDGHADAGTGTTIGSAAVYVRNGWSASVKYGSWLRFALNVPKNATITAAKLTLVSYAGNAGGAVRILANAADNPANPTTAAGFRGLVRTTAYVDWTQPVTVDGQVVDSPDFKNVIQEIVNRSGWVQNNACIVLLDYQAATGVSQWLGKDSGGTIPVASQPLLTVTYTAGAVAGTVSLAANVTAPFYDVAEWQSTLGASLPFHVAEPEDLTGTAVWDFWHCKSNGQRVRRLANVTAAQVSHVANGVGGGAIEVPLAEHEEIPFEKDDLILVLRRPPGGASGRVEMAFFVRRIVERETTVRLTGHDGNGLLWRRIVAYPAGSPQASKTGSFVTMLEDVVMESQFDAAGSLGRALFVETVRSQPAEPVLSRSFAWANVGDTLQKIIEAARLNGAAGATFAVEPLLHENGVQWVFQVSPGPMGGNHGSIALDPVIFSPDRGNLAGVELEWDWTEETSYVYAGGQGEGDYRNVVQRGTAELLDRVETFVDARNEKETAGVEAAAAEALNESRPRLRLRARLLDGPNARYGLQWWFGDVVSVQAHGRSFDVSVDVLDLSYGPNGETINCKAEIVQTVEG